MTRHSDAVLFSAATVGQGGEHHINERPLRFWQQLFTDEGFVAFDAIRPHLRSDLSVEPWYRYNAVLYVRRDAIGSLPFSVRSTEVENGRLKEIGDPLWMVRRSVLRLLPRNAVTRLAKWNARRKVKNFERA